jgi:hypothetical protein
MLTGWPTFIVGQTSNGPSAGHGAPSLKLAADPGEAPAPVATVRSRTMSARRFMTPALFIFDRRTAILKGLRLSLLPLIAVLLVGCGMQEARQRAVRVRGSSTDAMATQSCFLKLTQRIVGGGTSTYCLQHFRGKPGPHAVVHDSGRLTFRLHNETIRTRVRIVVKFAADGKHARQRLVGTVDGGGRISGGGPYVEDPPGHVASSNLRYVISR